MPEITIQDRAPALVIAGMHRSGTSLVASLCQAAGLDIGSHLLGSYPGNELGHFEDLKFVDWHQKVLRANGFGTEGFVAAGVPHIPDSLRQEAKALISRRRHLGVPWGWKDPRTTLHLDFWAELLPESRFLFVVRPPWDVIDSLYRRGDDTFRMNPLLAVQVWLHFNSLILDFVSRHRSRSLVCILAHAIEEPVDVFGAIRDHLGIPLADPPPLYQHDFLTRLDDAGRTALVATACPEAITVYHDLVTLAGYQPAALPPNRNEAAAAVGFQDWSETRHLEAHGRLLDTSLQEARDAVARLESQVQERHNAATALEHALRESHDNAASLNAAIQESQKTVAGLESLLQTCRDTEARLEMQLQESRDNAKQFEIALRESRDAAVDLKMTLRNAQAAREADALRSQALLDAAAHTRASLEQQAAVDRGRLNELGHRVNQRERRIGELEALLDAAGAAEAEAVAVRQREAARASAEREEIERRSSILESEVQQLRVQAAIAAERARDFERVSKTLSDLEASNSWKLTWPLRAARRVAITAPVRTLRRQLSALGRRLWRRLPWSIPEKQRIREKLFRRFGFLFRWTDSYREWHAHRAVLPGVSTARVPEALSMPHDELPLAAGVRVIAMHLPQFHRIPENDAWWGEGFTEWTNVRRGQPMYPGHEQPHVPHPDIGSYDLADPAVLERQAALAASYGIAGFCFYYYWFSGHRLLEKPLDSMLRSGKPDFPFCICWANENWTRTWDGHDTEVLLAQTHAPDDAERFIRDILPLLRDRRYIRVEGRPLIAVYRTESLPLPRRVTAVWRDICRAEGIGEIHLVAVRSFSKHDPAVDGFDAALQFPPLQIPAANLAAEPGFTAAPGFAGSVHDYEDAIGFSLAEVPHGYRMYRGVMPAWDNTPRRMERATSWVNATPERYGDWLAAAIDRTIDEQPPAHRLVFVNAWNEWAEGAHLEPDERHGYANLEQTARAIGIPVATRPTSPLIATTLPAEPPEVRSHAWARVCDLFGGEPRLPRHAFLADYVALLTQIATAGGSLRLEDGQPVARARDTDYVLDRRENLTAPLHRLWSRTAAADTPFCFVVLQCNHWLVTARCLDSLRRLESRRPVRIVVVDNGSTDEVLAATREAVSAMPEIELVETGANRGFAGGNNVGYAHVRERFGAAFVAVINNDTRIEDTSFIDRCEDIFDRYAYSVLGPDIVTPDGRHENPWNDVVYSPDDWRLLADMYDEDRAVFERTGNAVFRRPGTRTSDARFLPNPLLQGAAIVLSPVFVASSPTLFDERTNLYGEEFLFAIGTIRAGHFMAYSADVTILHEEGVTTGALPSDHKMRLGYANAAKAARLALTELNAFAAACRGEPFASDSPVLQSLLASPRRHILVDLLFCQPGFHGGGEYGKAVFKALVASAAACGDVQLWAALDPTLFIDGWVWEACREHAVNIVAVTSFREITELVNTGRFTSFFAPALVVYTGYEYQRKVGGELGFRATGTRVVGTLLDVRDLEMAEDWERIATARRQVGCTHERSLSKTSWEQERSRQAAHARDLETMYRGIAGHPSLDSLVTISDYSAASIRSRIGTSRPLDVLFPPRKDRPPAEPFAIPGIEPGRDEFVLMMNAGRIEKNAATAVAVFDRLSGEPAFAAEHPRLKLVLVGIGSLNEVGLGTLVNPDRFVTLPHLPPEHLEYLYREARCLVYPSFNEGFGYPPLEAMDHGTPSVIADNTSVPEVCGTAAVPCDPFDAESVTQAIRTILSAPPMAAELRAQRAAVAQRQHRDLDTLVQLVLDGVRPGHPAASPPTG